MINIYTVDRRVFEAVCLRSLAQTNPDFYLAETDRLATSERGRELLALHNDPELVITPSPDPSPRLGPGRPLKSCRRGLKSPFPGPNSRTPSGTPRPPASPPKSPREARR